MQISQMIHIIEDELKRAVVKGKDKIFVYPYKMIYKKNTYSIIHEEDKLVPIFSTKNEHEACEKLVALVKENVSAMTENSVN